MMAKINYVALCVTMLYSTLRMEAINPNESFVPFLYAEPHQNVCITQYVLTHFLHRLSVLR